MSSVTWLCVVGLVLTVVAPLTSYVAVGVMGLVMSPLFAWFDWHEFGAPPTGPSPRWWWRLGPTPYEDGGDASGFGSGRRPPRRPSGGRGGGSKVPARIRPGPRQPAGSQALPLPED